MRQQGPALGQKQTFAVQIGMSVLPPRAGICGEPTNVRFGPADIRDDYDRSGSKATARGKITLISVNSPGWVSTSIEPLCCPLTPKAAQFPGGTGWLDRLIRGFMINARAIA